MRVRNDIFKREESGGESVCVSCDLIEMSLGDRNEVINQIANISPGFDIRTAGVPPILARHL